jgi:hypothetical protein
LTTISLCLIFGDVRARSVAVKRRPAICTQLHKEATVSMVYCGYQRSVSRLFVAILGSGLLLAMTGISAHAQYIHQLSYNGSNWMDENLNGSLVEPRYTGVAAFATTPNDQLHVYYLALGLLDQDHVHQLFYNGVSWSDEDLTVVSGGEFASATSAVVGFSVGNYQYVYFVGYDAHVHQLLYNNLKWVDTDLTAQTGGSFAYDSNLVAFTTNPALHVYYTDANEHIHQLFATNGTNWQDQDLTQLAGGSEAALGSANMGGFHIDNLQYVYYLDLNAHIHQLYYNNLNWSDEDLTSLTKTSGAAGRDGIIAFAIPGTKKMRIYYLNGVNNHVVQLSSTNNRKWTSADLTKRSKGPLPGGDVTMGVFANANGQINLLYASGPDIYRMFQPTSTTWSNENLTELANGDEVFVQTQISGFSLRNDQYIYYVGD